MILVENYKYWIKQTKKLFENDTNELIAKEKHFYVPEWSFKGSKVSFWMAFVDWSIYRWMYLLFSSGKYFAEFKKLIPESRCKQNPIMDL